MKKFILFAIALMALAACEKADLSQFLGGEPTSTEQTKTKTFTFHVKGDFVTNYEEMGTRASVRLEDENTAGVTDLWVLDYDADGTLLQQVHQSSTDADFGHPSMNLTYGHHDIKLIASKGDNPLLTASALSWSKVKDTFTLDYPVDVTASSNGNRAPELKRAISGVKLVMTDVVPTDAGTIMMEYNRSLSLRLPSLQAEAVSVSGATNAFPDSWIGTKDNSYNVYTLCPTDEMTTDVHVCVLTKEGEVISDFTIADVSLKKNRMTTLKGEVFGRGSGFSVSIDDAWESPLEVTF